MILFASDWVVNGKVKAVVHRDTQNTSFLRVATIYHRMNLKNNLFHLALTQPDLAKYDPHNLSDSSIELRLRIAHECRVNLWYFLREVLRVPVDGGDPIRFEAHRGNISMAWSYLAGIDYFSVQPRQTGKAQPTDSFVKTPGGWTMMGHLKVGDFVTAPDGTQTKVIGVYPQGKRQVYRLVFDDGRYTRCCDEHLWKVYVDDSDEAQVLQLSDVRNIKGDVQIPCIASLNGDFEHHDFIDHVKYVCHRQEQHGIQLSTRVLNSSINSRYHILESLLKSDTRVLPDGRTVVRVMYNKTLAYQIQYIVRSLGGWCSIKETVISHKETKYEITIKVRDPKELFATHEEKSKITGTFTDKELRPTLVSITPAGVKQTQCIEVAHKDHLYITEGFIATHNTVGALALTTWTLYCAGRNMSVSMLTKDTKLLQENVSRVKGMRDAIPQWLIHYQTKDTDNKEGLHYAALNTSYKTFVGQSDKSAAANVGRGHTTPVLHSDETGFTSNMRITFAAFMPAVLKASANAKLNGMPHSNLYTTTAARTDTDEGKFAFELMDSAMPFREKIYDCASLEEALTMVKTNSVNNCINGTWSYLQLGKTHEWFVDQTSKIGASEDEIDRDFLNMWRAGTDTSILPADLVKRMKSCQQEPLFSEVRGEYVINWFQPENVVRRPEFRRKEMVLSMDSSENIGRDFTGLVLIDPVTMETVATFRCNESNLITLGIFVGEFLVDHANTVFIPERKSSASSIIDQVILCLLKHNMNPFTRIYNRVVQGHDGHGVLDLSEYARSGVIDSSARRHLGFQTTGKTRPFLFKNTLNKAVRHNAHRIYDTTIISELSALSAVNGRIDHTAGNHDDMAISYLLACWLIYEGKNLKIYGLDPSKFATEDVQSGGDLDKAHLKQQLDLRKKIRHYETLIDATTSDMVKKSLLQRLHVLKSQLDDSITIEPLVTDRVRQTYQDYGNVYTPQTVSREERRQGKINVTPGYMSDALTSVL